MADSTLWVEEEGDSPEVVLEEAIGSELERALGL